MKTVIKKATELKQGDILVIKNNPLKVVGKWGLAVSLDMYVSDEQNATSYTKNRKLTFSATQEFTVIEGCTNKSLFDIAHELKSIN